MLPFLALATAYGIVGHDLAPRRWIAALVVVAILPLEVAWGWHKTPALFKRENPVRVDARADAAAWLAATSRPDDILFAYEPLYLAAWEHNRRASRARSSPAPIRSSPSRRSTTRRSRSAAASSSSTPATTTTTSSGRRSSYACRSRAREFEGRVYGPYLIIRTTHPTRTIARYLDDARKAELIGKSLAMGDADINYATIRQAQARLVVRSRSSVSS